MFANDLMRGLLTGLPVLVAVGPIALLLVESGMTRGLRASVPAALGVAAGDTGFALVAAVGGGAAASLLVPVEAWLRVGGAVVLLGMAAHLARAARRRPVPAPVAAGGGVVPGGAVAVAVMTDGRRVGLRAAGEDPWRLAATFLGLTVVNPLTILLFVGIVVSGGEGTATPGWVAGMGLASLLVHGGFAASGHVLGATLSDRVVAGLHRAAPFLVGGLAVHLALT